MKVMFPVIPRALIITTACCSARRERERERGTERVPQEGRKKGREGGRRKSEVTPFLWQEKHGHRCTILRMCLATCFTPCYRCGLHTMLPLWSSQSSHHATTVVFTPRYRCGLHTTLPLWWLVQKMWRCWQQASRLFSCNKP